MAEYLIQGATLTAIADAIRTKTGEEGTMAPEQMPTKIMGITGSCGKIPYLVTLTNGTVKHYYQTSPITTTISASVYIPSNAVIHWVGGAWSTKTTTSGTANSTLYPTFTSWNSSYTKSGNTVRISKDVEAKNYFTYAILIAVTYACPGHWLMANNDTTTIYLDETVTSMSCFQTSSADGYAKADILDLSDSQVTKLNTFDLSLIATSKIVLPPTLTDFSTGLSKFHGVIDCSKLTSIPTITASAITAGDGLQILVPAALYDEWIAATNWSALADYIVAV